MTFFSPVTAAPANPAPAASIARKSDTAEPKPAIDGVGLDLRNQLSPAELEAHIKDLGRLAEQAIRDHDPTGARLWAERMVDAIKSRSPEVQAAMEAAIQRRIDEGVAYFMAEGDKARRLTHKD